MRAPGPLADLREYLSNLRFLLRLLILAAVTQNADVCFT